MGAVLEWIGWLERLFDQPLIKLVSYILSPILASVSFAFGLRHRADIVGKAEELGRLKEQVEKAQRALSDKEVDLKATRSEIEKKESAVEKLRRELIGITEGAQQIWKLRPGQPFAEYTNWLRDPQGAKILTIGNLKGGVGKTTLAANFAAYISETVKSPVLLVDLDYQGSLSNMLLLAVGSEVVESKVDNLLRAGADLATLERSKEHLVPVMSRAWLVPASYSLAEVENRLLLQWLLEVEPALDVRYRLAKVLLNPDVRQSYAAIILDTPPRMTIGTVNALVASHYFLVPTTLDKLSAEAVPQFIANMRAIKGDLALDLDLAGIVGMMSRTKHLNASENAALEIAREGGYDWEPNRDFVIPNELARLTAIADAAGSDVAYFKNASDGQPLKARFDPLFEDISRRIGLLNSQ